MSTIQEHSTAGQPERVSPRTRQRIVVGVDDSPASMHATEWAAAEACSLHVPLHIVHAWVWQHLAPWLTTTDRMVMSDLDRAGHRLVSNYRTAALREPGLEVTTEVRSGNAAEVLLDAAGDSGMVVVGTHHLRPTARVLLGSAGSALVSQATCPTIVVNASPESAVGRLVVGLAATKDDHAVLRFAFDHAERHGLPIRALYCWYPDAIPPLDVPIPEQAAAWLSESLAGWREQYPDVRVDASVRHVHPAAGLVNEAAENDILVVGRRAHRTRLAGHIGSVSLGVLHHANCTVAVIPS